VQMNPIDKLYGYLDKQSIKHIEEKAHFLREIRIRIGKPIEIISDEDKLVGSPVSEDNMRSILNILTDYSLYSKEDELQHGYFTLSNGSRVGVCGKMTCSGNEKYIMSHIGSICIRMPKEIRNCARLLLDLLITDGAINSAIIFSPPGFGKTTLLRDISRLLSETGYHVGLADERHEIAACINGVPSMDVGVRTDVLDGCPKHIAVIQLVRTMCPQVIISDEIGDERDASALFEAQRCGVAVVASVHSDDFDTLSRKPVLRRILAEGVFQYGIKLGEAPGKIIGVRKCILLPGGGITWQSA